MEHQRKRLMATPTHWGAISPGSGPVDDHHQLSHDVLDQLIIKSHHERREIRIPTTPPFSCKDWTLESLIATSPNFHHVRRVKYSPEIWDKRTDSGVPVVVEFHRYPKWRSGTFTPEWLMEHEVKDISARNRADKNVPLAEFIQRARATSPSPIAGETAWLYGKDVSCPPEWRELLHDVGIPRSMAPDGQTLLKNLPKSDQPETLMCCLGIADTVTPAHKDLCALQGHNLMTYAENNGSSFWFMTASSSANAVVEYFHNHLNKDIDHGTHVVTINQLASAPFDVYITEQKLGDLVLVPPRSAYQVINSGGLTIKTSWSRMTLEGLSLALRYELPLYRRVCCPETYRVKLVVYYSLLQTIGRAKSNTNGSSKAVLAQELHKLLLLFDSVLVDECSESCETIPVLSRSGGDATLGSSQLTCDFCGADIFQAFFECGNCITGEEKPAPLGAGFHICPGCYVEGRSCNCESMVPVQCRRFKTLANTRKAAISALSSISPSKWPSLRALLEKKGLFQAALVLHSRRKELREAPMRRCTVVRDKTCNHEIASFLQLGCQKCHSAMCFAHLVQDRCIHSTEALVKHGEDDTQAVYHQSHQDSQLRYAEAVAALRREEPNAVPDSRVQLAHLARTYITCRPVHPDSRLRKAGFYDLNVWESSETPRAATLTPTMPSTSATQAAPAQSKRRRFIMDYVYVPPHPPRSPSKPTASVASGSDRIEPQSKKVNTGNAATSIALIRRAPPASRNVEPKRRKEVVIFDDSGSDESPAKRPRYSGLNFRKKDPPLPVTLADAYNFAGEQNQVPVENEPSSSAPRTSARPAKRKRAPVESSPGEQNQVPVENEPSSSAPRTSARPAKRKRAPVESSSALSTSESGADGVAPVRKLPQSATSSRTAPTRRDFSRHIESSPASSTSNSSVGGVRTFAASSSRTAPTRRDFPREEGGSSSSADTREMQAEIAHLKAMVEELRAQPHLDPTIQQRLLNWVAPAPKESPVTEAFRAAGDFLKHLIPHMHMQLPWNGQAVGYPYPPGPTWPNWYPRRDWEEPQYARDDYAPRRSVYHRPQGFHYPRPYNRRTNTLPDVALLRQSWDREEERANKRRRTRFSERDDHEPTHDGPQESNATQEGTASDQAVVEAVESVEAPQRRPFPIPTRERSITPTQNWEDVYEREEPAA